MTYAQIPIDQQTWTEFVALFGEEMFGHKDLPVRLILERLVDSRDERTWKVLYALLPAAIAELADFVADHPELMSR